MYKRLNKRLKTEISVPKGTHIYPTVAGYGEQVHIFTSWGTCKKRQRTH
ncbi:hypothetical protein L21SP5_03172 [Salinivirga cyanobacteriivorans]|uniref:Uncharacterized protein n=1 Tax=Salinivirga cyanobacteriivorans TaxID=1307839 RepID=A0A0S2I2Z0_9BACT|nr:hypothetical protein L21SP5_03172 [Salinivirga cyanobacteriivorans]